MPTDHEKLLRGLAKGTGIVILGTVSARFLGFLTRALIGRYYGSEAYGMVSTGLAVMSIGVTVALFGFTSALPRQISYYLKKDKAEHVPEIALGAYCFSSVIALVLAGLFFFLSEEIAIGVFDDPELIPFLRFFGGGLLFTTWLQLSASIFNGLKKMVLYILLRDVVRLSMIIISLLIAVFLSMPARVLGLCYLLSYIVSAAVGFLFVYLFAPIRIKRPAGFIPETKNLIRFSWPIIIGGIVFTLSNRLDLLMIGHFQAQSEVGIYNAAVPIAELLTVVSGSFAQFLLPTLTGYYANNDVERIRETYQVSTKWILILTAPLFSVMFFFPETFITLVFGTEFLRSANALRILAVGSLLVATFGVSRNLLLVSGRTKLYLFNNVSAVLLNVVLNYFLIPQFGILGAAGATALSLFYHNLISLIQAYRIQNQQPFALVHFLILAIAVGLSAAMSGMFTPVALWDSALLFLAYGLTYFLSLKLFRCVDHKDTLILRDLKKAITNRKP